MVQCQARFVARRSRRGPFVPAPLQAQQPGGRVKMMSGILASDTTGSIAKLLASEHMRDDPSIRRIYRINHGGEVRLIEITEAVPATGEILPFRFTPDPPDIPVKSLIVLLHPKDWERSSELDWPPELNPATNEVELIAGA